MKEPQWRVRIPEGIFGPFSARQIQDFAYQGIMTGEEELALDGADSWKRVAELPEFYELILDLIEKGIRPLTPAQRHQAFQQQGKTTRAHQKTSSRDSRKMEELPPLKIEKKEKHRVEEVIELRKQVSAPRRRPFGLLPAVAIIAAALFYVLSEPNKGSSGGKVRLIVPKSFQDSKNEKELQQQLKSALSEFEKDDFRSYLKAQDLLVGLAETGARNSDALALLCLTYRELWPFAHQDSEDLATVSKVAQIASKRDPIGVNGATCKAVHLLVSGRFSEAAGLVDTTLSQKVDAVVFYEIKATLLEERKDFLTALPFAQKAKQLWTTYLKYSSHEGRLLYNLGRWGESAALYRSTLKSNPAHASSRLHLGLIDVRAGRTEDAIGLLNDALRSKSRMLPEHEAEGRVALAEVLEKRGDLTGALEQAKLAYGLKPEWQQTRLVLERLGGERALRELSALNRESMALGDQYYRSGNFLAAQAQFKAAFEESENNARAAMMVGKSLIGMHQTVQAIEWIQKSIQADPKNLEAHTLLADVYSQRFDFDAAQAVLRKIQGKDKNNPEVLRGFALVELRRNNFLATIQYAERALKAYDSDLGSHILMARGYLGQKNVREAYTWAAKAIELDQTHAEAQGLYGEVLAEFQGAAAGVNYVRNLIHTYPGNLEYRLSLARVLKKDEKNAEALAVLEQILMADPKNKTALLLQGELFQLEKKYDDALSAFLNAAALDPSDATPLYWAGHVYLSQNKPSEAVRQFERVLSTNARYPMAHFSIGRAALLMGDLDRAQRESELEKRMNPALADSYLLLGDVLMEKRLYSKAAQEFQRATKYRPNSAELYVKMARAYRMSGQPDAAISMLRVAATHESGRADIYREQGAVFESKGMPEAAIKSYKRYLELIPNAHDRQAIQDRIQNLGG